MAKKYWSCLIGGDIGELPSGSDYPLRIAVRVAYLDLTGEVDEVCASGWGIEFFVPENTKPTWEELRKLCYDEKGYFYEKKD